MKRIFTFAVAPLLAVTLWAGCNNGSPVAENDPATAVEAASEVQLPVEADAKPAQVVAAFLDAIRGGNVDVARHLLTLTARVETAKHDLVVQAPGTPNSTYEILTTEVFENGGANVATRWTEVSKQGRESFDITWVLRNADEGWRVAGMATQINEADQPLFLDFEDPAGMLERLAAAESALPDPQRARGEQTQVSSVD
ncbi:hypothetical protein [Lignipirellula cremea]|uniref:Uncharacterized protein n=1 Tax=Lignipirellula cremea TaxID=2528010 RepID=A0A518DV07_9BACT|nr:hypothetical protein [Lignipirellula cremea]QDU95657.1 hypothetical protein Pla8534_34740 [Lignipirellula cremea]